MSPKMRVVIGIGIAALLAGHPANGAPEKGVASGPPQKGVSDGGGGSLGDISDYLIPGRHPGDARLREAGSRFGSFWAVLLEFRGRSVRQGNDGWKRFSRPDATKRLEALDRVLWEEGQSGEGWSFFFSLALFDIAFPTANNPLVGFYHPWSDVWLLTQWQTAPNPQIVDVELVVGEWLRQRGKPPLDLRPDWLRREGFRTEQLARAVVENIGGFDALMREGKPWWQSLQLAERAELVRELNYPAAAIQLRLALLRAAQLAIGGKEPPVLQPLVDATREFVRAGREGQVAGLLKSASATTPDSAGLLEALPPPVYGLTTPVYWAADERHAAVFLAGDTNPDFCLALAYDRVGAGVRLQRVDVLHFPSLFEANRKKKEGK